MHQEQTGQDRQIAETPFRKKHHPSPNAATRTPAIAGPTIRAALNIDEFSAIAFIRSSRPTNCDQERLPGRDVEGVDDPQQRRQGEDVPELHPPRERQPASAKARTIAAVCVAMMIRCRLRESARLPPSGESRNTGNWPAKPTRPRSTDEPVSR